jgi:hypothetical protein
LALANEKSLRGDDSPHLPAGSARYLKPKLQALRIPISLTTNAKISEEVAKNKIQIFGFEISFGGTIHKSI